MSTEPLPLRSSLRFEKNETVIVRDLDRTAKLWVVAGRHDDGWLLTPLDGSGERHLFSHRTIFDHYVCGRITRLGRVHRELDAEEEMRVRRAWDGAPAWARTVAERRYVMLRACREQRKSFRSMAEAFRTVPGQLVAAHGASWAAEDRELRPAKAADQGSADTPLDANISDTSPYWVPCERTMWRWHDRCRDDETNVRRLLPHWTLRGDGRPLFGAEMVDLMDDVIEGLLKKKMPMAVKLAYDEIFKPRAEALLARSLRTATLEGQDEVPGAVVAVAPDRVSTSDDAPAAGRSNSTTGVSDGPAGALGATITGASASSPEPVSSLGTDQPDGADELAAEPRKRRVNPIPSLTTFWRRFGEVDPARKTKSFHGHRQVRLDWGTFDEAEAPPFYMNQVEADHSFINMNVKCEITGRVLGRPWLTAIRERRTKVLLGLHVSFLPPSWMTLSRALAHSLWPKNLTGFSGLKNDWFCHGVFDWMLTDRGLDFLGNGLRQSGRLIGFEIGNLAGFSPWLKGGLERTFRTLKGQVFSYRDGTSAWRAVKHYDPQARADMTLAELKAELVTWVVDKYLFKEHGSLGMSPADRWAMEMASHGPVRPVGDFFDVRRLFCRLERRSIQKLGIEVDGLIYNFRSGDPRGDVLGQLRGRGGQNQWQIMIDPFDLRSIFLEDPHAGVTEDTWIEIPCTRPELAVNVTQPQHELHKMIARLTSPGEQITEAMLLRAKDQAESRLLSLGKKWNSGTASRMARYRDDGSFLTPISIGGPPVQFSVVPTTDWGAAEFDPRTGQPIVPGDAAPTMAITRIGTAPGPVAPDADRNAVQPRSEPHKSSSDAPTDADWESMMAEAMAEMEAS